MKLNTKGLIDHTLILAIVAILAAGGFVFYRISNASDDISKLNTDTVSGSAGELVSTVTGDDESEAEEAEEEVQEQSSIPEGYSLIQADGFNYLYPDKYPDAEIRSQSEEGATIQTSFFGEIEYVAEQDQWYRLETSTTDRMLFDLDIARRDSDFTVFFDTAGNRGENGTVSARSYIFFGNGQLYELRMPSIYTDNEGVSTFDQTGSGQVVPSLTNSTEEVIPFSIVID